MKVFGIGFNKTGTTTFGECCKVLGLHHAPYDAALLEETERGEFQRFDEFAARFDSFEDWPWPLYFERLARLFPAARFVLTERSSPEVWWDSLCAHADRTGPTRDRELAYGFSDPAANRDELLRQYVDHGRAVREFFADRPGRLLTLCWEREPGWDELCEFLGMPIPLRPLPHENARPNWQA